MPNTIGAHTFKFKGRLPSMNDYIDAARTNKYAAAAMKKNAQESVIAALIESGITKETVKTPLHIGYHFYEKSPKRDCDNVFSFASKVIQDAFVEAGIIPNDSPKYVNGFSANFNYGDKEEFIYITLLDSVL